MLSSLGLEEVLLVAVLAGVMFSPQELGRFVRKLLVWKATLQSWAQGMYRGLWEER
ncbi:MAG: hypothetical protein H6922_06065 [Pseudomonadaceae bacterium]|nr:hypothetical protein [Pseudomonadaceae bacterium]